jgi:hypothetical protein
MMIAARNSFREYFTSGQVFPADQFASNKNFNRAHLLPVPQGSGATLCF